MRKFGKILPGAMAVCMALSVVSVPAKADAAATDSSDAVVEETEKVNEAESTEYKLVFNEEFNDSYDSEEFRSKWNVELHEAGWVNEEWQEYVDSEENIEIKDGVLKINPVKKEEEIVTPGGEEQFTNTDFSNGMTGWTSSEASWSPAEFEHSISNGAITYDIQNVGNADWNVQFKRENVSLKAGTTYHVSYNIKSSVERPIVTGVMTSAYSPYKEITPTVGADGTKVEFEFTPSVDDDTAVFYITMGKVTGLDEEIGEHSITISDVSMTTVVKEEKFTNTDFSDGMTGWTSSEASWSKAEFENSISNGAITYNISNVGEADWNVQFKKENVALEAGGKYHVSYNITSTVERPIASGVMTASYSPYKEVTPTVGTETKKVEFDFTPSADDDTAVFYITMGKVTGLDEEIGEHSITISDLSMTKVVDAKPTTKTKTTYTSGRISTQNKETFTYGKFECRAKVPSSMGYLPAFWLMANDESVYGQWPKCGEIDIMEIMGGSTDTLYGTIHYGLPKGSKQGTYNDGTDFSKDFHTYTCEWEPGKITWYVDDKEYYTTSTWYSATEGQGTLTYPAPFDQPFYIILNLAVGNKWAGRPNETTSYDESFEVDYVKVYQKDEEVYAKQEAEAKAPENTFDARQPDEDGNYIINGKFEAEELADEENWVYLTNLGGVSTATIADNELTIDITNEGTVDYSNQLVQALVPLEKGASYEISFDASATGDITTMNVDVKAPDFNYATYMSTYKPELTSKTTTYTIPFKMTAASDANARLEFNMGTFGTGTIKLSNVSIKKTADADPEELNKKTVLANGNYIYNGKFEEGEKHLGYWDITEGADVLVSSLSDGRRCIITNTDEKEITFSQSDLAFPEGKTLAFSFDAKTTHDQTVEAIIGGNKYTFNITGDGNKAEYKVKLPSTTEFTDKTVTIKFTNSISIDNVMLCEDAMIKNGDFSNGLTGFESYFDAAASAEKGIDALSNDGNDALQVTINNTGTQDWNIQMMQRNIKLEQGKKYRLTYDAKSSINREIRVVLQGLEPRGYEVYSEHSTDEDANDGIVALTSEYKHFTEEFEMTAETDEVAQLSICYGAVNGAVITDKHTVTVDNLVLEEITDETEQNPDVPDEPMDPVEISNVEVTKNDVRTGFAATIEIPEGVDKEDVEFKVVAVKDGEETVVSEWTKGENEVEWTPEVCGEYELKFMTRVNGDDETIKEETAEYSYHPALSGVCQMVDPEGRGFLIGLTNYDDLSDKYSCEMLILDCTLLAKGEDAWVYSTGRCGFVDHMMWTTWNPQYGYYWTLFRVYDENGDMIDEICYGFENI